MTTGKPVFSATAGIPTRTGEQWPAALAAAAILGLTLTVPIRVALGPVLPLWSLLLAELCLVVAVAARMHRVVLAVSAAIAAASVSSLALLAAGLLRGRPSLGGDRVLLNGQATILAAGELWLTSVLVFALWYWALDGWGGGMSRWSRQRPAFLFPQLAVPTVAPTHWAPTFVDYVYVAFSTASVVGLPAHAPLTPQAKLLTILQALASLLSIVVIAVGVQRLS